MVHLAALLFTQVFSRYKLCAKCFKCTDNRALFAGMLPAEEGGNIIQRIPYANSSQSFVHYGWNVILGTSVTADCGASCGFAAVSTWSGEKNLQRRHPVLIVAGKLSQMLSFTNWQLMVSLSHMLPAAAFSLRFHFSVSIVGPVLPFYDLNSDGCNPVWNESPGCEYGPSSASCCCHLVSGRKKSSRSVTGDMSKLVCWRCLLYLIGAKETWLGPIWRTISVCLGRDVS